MFLTCVCLWSYFLVKYTYVFKSQIFNGEMEEENMLFWIRACNFSVALALNTIEYFLAEDLDQFITFQILNHGKYWEWEWEKSKKGSLFCHEKFLFVGRYHNPHLPPVFYYLGSAMAFSITCIQIHIRYSNYKGKKQWNML